MNKETKLTVEEKRKKVNKTILSQIRVGNDPKLRMSEYNVATMIQAELELLGLLTYDSAQENKELMDRVGELEGENATLEKMASRARDHAEDIFNKHSKLSMEYLSLQSELTASQKEVEECRRDYDIKVYENIEISKTIQKNQHKLHQLTEALNASNKVFLHVQDNVNDETVILICQAQIDLNLEQLLTK